MKRLVFLMIVVLIAIGVKAQVSQIAVLSNEGKFSLFYGRSALIDAYEKAVDGDVITLSAGSFYSVDIKKAITLRGVGIQTMNPTYIYGGMEVELPEESSDLQMKFEGLTFTEDVHLQKVKDVIFQKCEFYTQVFSKNDSYMKENHKDFQYSFVHCLANRKNARIVIDYGNISLVNSVVSELYTDGNNKYQNFNIVNSIVCSGSSFSKLENCNFTNSIIYSLGDSKGIGNSSLGSNCIAGGCSIQFNFGNKITYFQTLEELFKEGTFYELTDKAAAVLGTDGKQVGIYGGNFPFEAAVSGPKVKKFDVSSKTTADGKLSVDIEIAE